MPRYNLATKQGVINAKSNLSYHISKGSIIDQKAIKKTRSNTENRALHLYYRHVADALLDIGCDFVYTDEITGEKMEIPYTGDMVKNFIWRPLQETMFKIESTTKLTNQMINDILDVLSLWLSGKNKMVKFPNRIELLIKQMNENELL